MTDPAGSRVYRALLRSLPRRFREAHAVEMEELFREALETRSGRGRPAWLSVWARGIIDVLILAIRLRVRRLPTGLPARNRRGLLNSLREDLRFGVRMLVRRPAYAAVAVLTLGLGIGASTAMFSVVHGILLKPLPYDEPDRLVAIWQTVPFARELPGDDGRRWDRTRLTWSQYRDLVDNSVLYEGLAAYRGGNPDVATLTGVGDPVEMPAGAATPSLLPLLGVRPVQGRWFLPGEEASASGNDGSSVSVVSYELWQDRFGGSPDALGRTIAVNGRPFTIIGILPPGFRLQWLSATAGGESDPGRRDIWFPIGAPGWRASQQGYSYETIGRLAAGVTVEQVRVETQRILSGNADTFADARVLPRPAEETRGLTAPLFLLFGATGLLLLITCANIATLSMAESLGRRHEIATRSALGAETRRIARLLLTEMFVLAALGTGVGVAIAFAGTRALVALAPPIPHLHEVGVDPVVLGFAVALGTCAAFLSGTIPSILASRGAAGRTLLGARGASPARRRFASIAIATEIALTTTLLVAGGLLARSYARLMAIDPGFESSGVATVEARLPRNRYPFSEPERRVAFFRDVLDRLGAVPGIGQVGAASRLPFPGYTSAWGMRIEATGERLSSLGYQVSPDYLAILGVPLLAGRGLTEADGPGAPLAVVINETMARRYWPHESPLGARLDWSGSTEPVTVVGIVGDMKRQVLDAEAEPAFFIPFSQHPDETIGFVARTQRDPQEVLALMRDAVRSVDDLLVVKNATTLATLVSASASDERYRTLLLSFFAVLATALAAAGVVGVTARSVALRTRELGIRMVLGARGSGLIGTTVLGNLRIGLIGTAVGLTGALWASSFLGRFLFGIGESDPPTFAAVAAVMLGLCLMASYVPARRISRVNPRDVLKAE